MQVLPAMAPTSPKASLSGIVFDGTRVLRNSLLPVTLHGQLLAERRVHHCQPPPHRHVPARDLRRRVLVAQRRVDLLQLELAVASVHLERPVVVAESYALVEDRYRILLVLPVEQRLAHLILCLRNLLAHVVNRVLDHHVLAGGLQVVEGSLKIVMSALNGCSQNEQLRLVVEETETLLDAIQCLRIFLREKLLDGQLLPLICFRSHQLNEFQHLWMLWVDFVCLPEVSVSLFVL